MMCRIIQPGVFHNDAIHDPLWHFLFHSKSRICQCLVNAGAKPLQPLQESELLFPGLALLVKFLQAVRQDRVVLFGAPMAVLQLGQCDDSDRVGIDEPLHFPFDPLELALDADVFALVAADERRIAPAFLVACPEPVGFGEQILDGVPYLAFDPRSRDTATLATPWCRTRITCRADIAAVRKGGPGAD